MAIIALVLGLVLYAGRDPWFDLVEPLMEFSLWRENCFS
jgi:hypothetical protein